MKIAEYIVHFIVLVHLRIVGLINPDMAVRAKRMLFLTSLATALAREGIIKRNVLDTLNRDLRLAKNDRCLLLARELSPRMWYHPNFKRDFNEDEWVALEPTSLKPEQYLSLDDIRLVSNSFIKAAPKWVKYDRKQMYNDVTDLLMTCPVMKTMRFE